MTNDTEAFSENL